jgi:hypothetical protein
MSVILRLTHLIKKITVYEKMTRSSLIAQRKILKVGSYNTHVTKRERQWVGVAYT